MVQLCGGFDLAQEPFGTERGSELGVEHLDGDLAAVFQILGQKDGSHPAPAEFALDGVAVG
jgi:hypothetical protein